MNSNQWSNQSDLEIKRSAPGTINCPAKPTLTYNSSLKKLYQNSKRTY